MVRSEIAALILLAVILVFGRKLSDWISRMGPPRGPMGPPTHPLLGDDRWLTGRHKKPELPDVHIDWTKQQLEGLARLASRREAAKPSAALVRALRR
jgi:hypothetical protein